MTDFTQIDTIAIIDSIAAQITAKILSGELKAGDKLPAERELAEKLGVSRSSVHQAILRLEGQGLLSIAPRKGTVVSDYRKHPTPQSLTALMSYNSIDLEASLFSDMMDTRLWLESECARLACSKIYPSTLEQMRSLVDAMKLPDSDLTDLIYKFHYALTRASGNSLYAMIFRGFEPVIRSLIGRHYNLQAVDLQESVSLRYELLEAIEQKDEERAIETITSILRQGVNVLKQRYE